MTDETDDGSPGAARVSRRQLLSMGAAAGVAVGTGAINPAKVTAASATKPIPEVIVAPLSEIQLGSQLLFEYPDNQSPAIMLRLDGPIEGGVGPDQSIVAYSLLCTHKGCPVSWNPEQKMLICPCHWSSFDPALKGRMIIGQASQGLAQITLRIADGSVSAVGVDGMIYGRQTNIL